MNERERFPTSFLENWLKELTRLKRHGPYSTMSGICWNSRIGEDIESYGLCVIFAKGWKHHSGNPSYPVVGYSWSKTTDSGRRRWQLLNYLIKGVKAELARREQ